MARLGGQRRAPYGFELFACSHQEVSSISIKHTSKGDEEEDRSNRTQHCFVCEGFRKVVSENDCEEEGEAMVLLLDLLYGAPAWTILLRHWNTPISPDLIFDLNNPGLLFFEGTSEHQRGLFLLTIPPITQLSCLKRYKID